VVGLIHLLVLFRLKGVIFLCQVAERDNDDRCEDLGNGWINVKLFYKELDEDIIQQEADHHQEEIPEQLHPSV